MSALCLHYPVHLPALGATLACTCMGVLRVMTGRRDGIGGQARRLLLLIFRAPYTEMSGWHNCYAAWFCRAGKVQ